MICGATVGAMLLGGLAASPATPDVRIVDVRGDAYRPDPRSSPTGNDEDAGTPTPSTRWSHGEGQSSPVGKRNADLGGPASGAAETPQCARCREIDAFVEAHEDAFRIVATVNSPEEGGPAEWRRFTSEEELQETDTGENLNETAYVWSDGERIFFVRTMFQSPSRDWAHYVSSYYGEDGRLLMARSDLRTFYGDVRAVREMHFDAAGRVAHESRQYSELDSDEPLDSKPAFMDQEPTLFMKVSDLPFLHLLAAAEEPPK